MAAAHSQQPAPSKKSERRATLAVRLAQKNSHESQLLAAGTLPGRKQTASRAELWAVIIAMSTCTNSMIYTDCKGVTMASYSFRDKAGRNWLGCPPRTSICGGGPWSILNCPGRCLMTEWTRSHQRITDAQNANEMWKTYHNGLTDLSERVEVNPLPNFIQPIRQRLTVQNAEQEKWRSSAMCYLKEIWRQHSAAETSADVGVEGQ